MFKVGDKVKVCDNVFYKLDSEPGKVIAVIDCKRVRVKFDKFNPKLTRYGNRNGVVYHIDFVDLVEEAETEDKSDKFWVVMNGPHNVRHTSREKAEADAERLAKDNPGVEFFVLEAVSSVKAVGVVKRTL